MDERLARALETARLTALAMRMRRLVAAQERGKAVKNGAVDGPSYIIHMQFV